MMAQSIVGRSEEINTLKRMYYSNKSEFVILYGRRRVGKTFLVNQTFMDDFSFRITGVANITQAQQLLNFAISFNEFNAPLAEIEPPSSWFQAFQLIKKLVSKTGNKRKVIFFDELPWLDANKSDFLSALEHFWNSWASLRADILLIGCGSSASWMINKLIHNRGGLHNRITERIYLQPFTLNETEVFLRSKGAVYDRYQLLELYMVMGGIPFYLENIQVNRSIAQNIDRMFFSQSGILRLEYISLYRSLFNNYDKHVAIVEALATKSKGMLKKELLKKAKLSDGGSTTTILEELKHSGFIDYSAPFGKKKRGTVYRLIDPYSLFYLTFVKNSKAKGEGAWLARINNPQWRAWSGYAFEGICIYHIKSIKKTLGIGGVYTEISPWRSKKSEAGAEIDLLIDRNDRVINICEMKFSTSPFTITKTYATNLENKLTVFRNEFGTKKTLFLTIIATYGLKQNKHSLRLVNEVLDMSALFD